MINCFAVNLLLSFELTICQSVSSKRTLLGGALGAVFGLCSAGFLK